METKKIKEILESGEGILSMAPNWVPRPFNRPGKRIRLHPDDYYAMGLKRGAIVERWFSSVTKVETDGAGEFEGMSFVNTDGNTGHLVLFKDFVDELGAGLIGGKLMDEYGTWPMYSKFYDYNEPLFHHVHHKEEACAKVGVKPKHEHYFFHKQYNNHLGIRPVSYFGFDPSVTKEMCIRDRICTAGSQKHGRGRCNGLYGFANLGLLVLLPSDDGGNGRPGVPRDRRPVDADF